MKDKIRKKDVKFDLVNLEKNKMTKKKMKKVNAGGDPNIWCICLGQAMRFMGMLIEMPEE
jgi:hypothetical protein